VKKSETEDEEQFERTTNEEDGVWNTIIRITKIILVKNSTVMAFFGIYGGGGAGVGRLGVGGRGGVRWVSWNGRWEQAICSRGSILQADQKMSGSISPSLQASRSIRSRLNKHSL
jgi:hypothetical protein